jgi:hypothetical protein
LKPGYNTPKKLRRNGSDDHFSALNRFGQVAGYQDFFGNFDAGKKRSVFAAGVDAAGVLRPIGPEGNSM